MTFTREAILAELKRTASENGGVPLGSRRFESDAGIRSHEWQRFWPRFSEALKAAGLEPNLRKAAIPDDDMLIKLAVLTRSFGRRPTAGELRVAKREDPSIPSIEAFLRMGNFETITERLRAFVMERSEFQDVAAMLPASAAQHEEPSSKSSPWTGSVYLLKAGRHYKIGRSNASGRRERELAIQLPERAAIIHEIKTDDPPGIEKYWHSRFSEKRMNGEWFNLSQEDVTAFRRRKFM